MRIPTPRAVTAGAVALTFAVLILADRLGLTGTVSAYLIALGCALGWAALFDRSPELLSFGRRRNGLVTLLRTIFRIAVSFMGVGLMLLLFNVPFGATVLVVSVALAAVVLAMRQFD